MIEAFIAPLKDDRAFDFLFVEIPAACYIVDCGTQDSMHEKQVKEYYKDKLREVAVHVGTVAADVTLGAIWLIGEYCLEHFLVPRFPVDTPVARAALWVFRVLFAVSTLIPCASKIRKHVTVSWLQDSAEIKNVRDEVRANNHE